MLLKSDFNKLEIAEILVVLGRIKHKPFLRCLPVLRCLPRVSNGQIRNIRPNKKAVA